MCVARELTKRFETVTTGTVNELSNRFGDETIKGEIVLLIAPAKTETGQAEATDIDALLAELLADMPAGKAAREAAQMTGLSAGQRARLVLARALLSTAPAVLVDEPTAHLDPASAQLVHDVLADLARERAVVAVTHRAELVAHADRHVVLEPVGADR